MQKRLILGSSSPYRKALLQRLNLTFDCLSPNINEKPLVDETAVALVTRLAQQKAQAIIDQNTDNSNKVIITSDQVACLDKHIIGKPLTQDRAIEQLSLFSGKKITFITSLNVFDSNSGISHTSTSHYCVFFRELSQEEIKGYIEIEQPLDCAGSFKCEGLGVALFNKMEGDDPNSLIGLPLIDLCKLLRKCGINPLINR